MNEENEIKKLIEENKIKSIYIKNFTGENENVFIEILKCNFCEKQFLLIRVDLPFKVKTNIKKLLYDIKAHLSKHKV